MNTNRDVLSGSDLEMPSGFEVEAATFHAPVVAEVTVITPERPETSMKDNVMDKLDAFRTQSRMKLHDVQHLMTARGTMQRSMDQANTSVHTGFNDMQADMKVNPMKWAGIAAGSGFAIGMIGRFIHWRNKHRHLHATPQLVIIESAC
jgi:hypothetical protein